MYIDADILKENACLINPDKVDRIKTAKLAACIKTYISHTKIQQSATAAAWLGNDETHYIRKWEDRDVSDLKRFIDTCVYWIIADYNASDAGSMVNSKTHTS